MIFTTTLKRHSFRDRPDWIVVNPNVPLGTEYRILAIKVEGIFIKDLITEEEREVMCYLVTREGDTRPGYIPVDVFND